MLKWIENIRFSSSASASSRTGDDGGENTQEAVSAAMAEEATAHTAPSLSSVVRCGAAKSNSADSVR